MQLMLMVMAVKSGPPPRCAQRLPGERFRPVSGVDILPCRKGAGDALLRLFAISVDLSQSRRSTDGETPRKYKPWTP
jgi:hypothetical protein